MQHEATATASTDDPGQDVGWTPAGLAAVGTASIAALLATAGVVSLLRVEVFVRVAEFCRNSNCTPSSDAPILASRDALEAAGLYGPVTTTFTYAPLVLFLLAVCGVLLAASLAAGRRAPQQRVGGFQLIASCALASWLVLLPSGWDTIEWISLVTD